MDWLCLGSSPQLKAVRWSGLGFSTQLKAVRWSGLGSSTQLMCGAPRPRCALCALWAGGAWSQGRLPS